MRGAPLNRRGGKVSYVQNPSQQLYDQRNFTNSRDSDASFCSSRPSSIGISGGRPAGDYIKDRSYQESAIREIKCYLDSQSSHISLKLPFPSAKDISETLRFVIARLDYPSDKLEEDLPVILKIMGCPFKLNKSAIRAPGTPHTWPTFLAVIHWLVQLATYNEHMSISCREQSISQDKILLEYTLDSYYDYINGDDASVDARDKDFMEKCEREKDLSTEKVAMMRQQVADLEAQLEQLKTGPSKKEQLEKEKSVLNEDVKKFQFIIADVEGKIAFGEKVLEEKEKQLQAKVEENGKICEENEELKKKIESQTFNSRDAERMKRELQAVERNIGEAQASRNEWEEKLWDLDAVIGRKYKELEALSIECNQSTKRLKLRTEIQYVLNVKETTLSGILGIDYKSAVKPMLNSFADDIKKGSMEKLEELTSLQQQSNEIVDKVEGKKKQFAALQTRIGEMEAISTILKNETQDYTSKCVIEAKRMAQEIESGAQNLDAVEREATDMLQEANLNLQEATRQSEEEVQVAARGLLAVIDSVSQHKEYMSSKVADMRGMLMETASFVADTYKGSLPAQFGIDFSSKN